MRELSPRDRPQRGTLPDLRKLLPRPGTVRHSEAGRHRLFAGIGTRSWHRGAQRGRTETAAGPHRAAEAEGKLRRRLQQTGHGRRIWHEGGGFATARADVPANGHGKTTIGHGSVLIAAITSCTNTSNPSVMLAAGLLAKKAVERGLSVNPARQGVAGARLARGQRLPEQDRPATVSRPAGFQSRRLRLHHVHRQFRSAGRAGRGRRRQKQSGRRVGPVRQSQFRGARASEHQGEFPHVAAAGRRVRAGGPGGH